MALPQLEGFWDSPFVSGIAFAPRATPRTGRCDARVCEGVLAVADAELGWCLYRSADAADAAPVVIYFHANAETAADVEHLAPLFAAAGCAAVLVFDYRGYGWSTGRPTLGTLMPDMSRVATALPALLSEHMLADRPLIVYGRSLGAACAVHVTSLAPAKYAGLVLDSGLQDIRALPMVASLATMMNAEALLSALPDPLGTAAKLARVVCPLLLLHSATDEIIPFEQSRVAYAAAGSSDKLLHTFHGSGHNDILAKHREEYQRVLTAFLRKAANAPPPPVEDAATLRALSVRELRARVEARGLNARACLEKSDFVALLLG